MTALAQGSTATVTVGDGGYVTIATNGGFGSATITSTVGAASSVSFGPWADRRKLGPFSEGASVTLVNTSCGAFDYDYAAGDGGLTSAQTAATQALVSGAGNPPDLLTGTVQRVTITGAMSTTATQAAAATGTYTKARVVWNNNGASASAKLRIAVNADNDVHGLMIGQNVKRRDYEMTMGDGVMLVCGVPITRLTFSADGAITGGTHQLQVTFGN